MSNFAVNDAGDVMEFDGSAWKPARVAVNDNGDKVFFDGTAWKSLSGTTGAGKGQADARGVSDGLAQSVGQGVTMGGGDELTAAVRAAAPGLANWMMSGPALQRDESIGGSPTPQTVSTAPTYQGRYDEELARERGKAKSFHEEHPVLATGGNIAGSAMGAAALSAVPGIGALLKGSATLGANVAKGVAGGALLGGAAGFGEGEGGFDARLNNAKMPAVLGAALGGALPVAVRGGEQVYERLAPKVLDYIAGKAESLTPKVTPNSLSAAAPDGGQVVGDSFATQVADATGGMRGRIDDRSAVARLAAALGGESGVTGAERRLGQLGQDAFIADTGKGASRLATTGHLTSDAAADKYVAAFDARNAGTGRRFIDSMGENANVPTLREAKDFMDVYTSAKGKQIYDPVLRGDQPLNVSPEMQDLMKVPLVKDAFDTVKGFFSSAGKTPTEAELAHGVKQALYANSDAARAGGKPISPALVSEIDNSWRKALHDANPHIRAADEAYGPIASVPEWIERGGKFMRSGSSEAGIQASPSSLAADLPTAAPAQVNAFKVGSSNVLRETGERGADATRRLAKDLQQNELLASKLDEIYGPGDAGRMRRQGATELTFQNTRKDVVQGSPTAERTAALGRETNIGAPPMGGDIAATFKWLSDTAGKLNAPSDAVRSRLADMLANPNAEANAETLALVRALLAQQAAGGSIRAGVAGGAGAQGGR